MHSVQSDPYGPGCPIRKSRDPSLFTGSLWLIAGYHVLHRLLTPRHPPCALCRLITPTRRRATRTTKVDRTERHRAVSQVFAVALDRIRLFASPPQTDGGNDPRRTRQISCFYYFVLDPLLTEPASRYPFGCIENDAIRMLLSQSVTTVRVTRCAVCFPPPGVASPRDCSVGKRR